jgi:peroxiredoxin
VEIWRDFQAKRLNDAGQQWLWRNDTGQEPWVFVIGADGRITARFDNVATRGELEPLLERLPRR